RTGGHGGAGDRARGRGEPVRPAPGRLGPGGRGAVVRVGRAGRAGARHRTAGARAGGHEPHHQGRDPRGAGHGHRRVAGARGGAAGEWPAWVSFRVSVQMGFANPASTRIAEQFGANTYNVPTDLSLDQLAAIRAAVDLPIDLYVEVPDDLGGFVRHFEIAEIV